jgi:hypothetical protein
LSKLYLKLRQKLATDALQNSDVLERAAQRGREKREAAERAPKEVTAKVEKPDTVEVEVARKPVPEVAVQSAAVPVEVIKAPIAAVQPTDMYEIAARLAEVDAPVLAELAQPPVKTDAVKEATVVSPQLTEVTVNQQDIPNKPTPAPVLFEQSPAQPVEATPEQPVMTEVVDAAETVGGEVTLAVEPVIATELEMKLKLEPETEQASVEASDEVVLWNEPSEVVLNEIDAAAQPVIEQEPVAMPELAAPIEEVEVVVSQLVEILESAEPELSEVVTEIIAEIMALPAQIELADDTANEVIEQKLQELFIELFDEAAVEYTPQLVASFVALTKAHYMEVLLDTAKAKTDQTDAVLTDMGTREFLQKLQRGLTAIKQAALHFYELGRSALQLYGFPQVV